MTLGNYRKEITRKIPDSIPDEYLDSYFNSFFNSYTEIEPLISYSDQILDVGSGAGFLVNYLSSQGYKIQGFDNYLYNPHTRAINRAINSREEVKNCDIRDFHIEKKFDVIFLHNVIEHLDNWEESVEMLNTKLNNKGKIIFLLPNYSFPIECHFMLPIFLNRDLTYKIFKKRIKKFEVMHNREGLWDSLNFIKPKEIRDYYLSKNYNVKFDKSYFTNFLSRLIHNINPKSVHRTNKLHYLLVLTAKIFYKTKLINIYQYLPLSFQPFIKIIIQKP
tara:strand:+ start:20 stop:847 length:828 start_codon:yes stop_codon:yes gene_type:complete